MLPAKIDLDLIYLAIAIARNKLNTAKAFLDEGTKIYDEEFNQIELEIRNLNTQVVIQNLGTLDNPGLKFEVNEGIEEIFKNFCKIYHPDINPKEEAFFRDAKHLYDSGDFLGFLECCKLKESSIFLAFRYNEIESKLEKISQEPKFQIGSSVIGDREMYHKVMLELWINLNTQKKRAEILLKK